MDSPKTKFAMTFLRRRADKNRSIPTPDLAEVAGDADMDEDLQPFQGKGEASESLLASNIPDPFEEDADPDDLIEPVTRPDPKANRLNFLKSYLTSRTIRRG